MPAALVATRRRATGCMQSAHATANQTHATSLVEVGGPLVTDDLRRHAVARAEQYVATSPLIHGTGTFPSVRIAQQLSSDGRLPPLHIRSTHLVQQAHVCLPLPVPSLALPHLLITCSRGGNERESYPASSMPLYVACLSYHISLAGSSVFLGDNLPASARLRCRCRVAAPPGHQRWPAQAGKYKLPITRPFAQCSSKQGMATNGVHGRQPSFTLQPPPSTHPQAPAQLLRLSQGQQVLNELQRRVQRRA